MSLLIKQGLLGISLLAFSSMALASVVPVSEPGPFGLLAMGGLAILIASRIKRGE
ncbi:MAG: hypothetical protein KJN90_12545 [Gammaproteobacteria bacterium]|nr:hypothetical protein [Gammaproteobacteria bacterium]